MLDLEALAIMRGLANGVKTYDQVIEVGCVAFRYNIVLTIVSQPAPCFFTARRGIAFSRFFPLSSKRGH